MIIDQRNIRLSEASKGVKYSYGETIYYIDSFNFENIILYLNNMNMAQNILLILI